MNYENIFITTENNIATITINRPTKLNALNVANLIWTKLSKYRKYSSCYCFNRKWWKVAGADISEFAHFSIAEGAN
jgi:enoyl-CoA hydratase